MTMRAMPLRLLPGDDLRAAVVAALQASGCAAAFVLQGIGSLSVAQLRLADQPEPTALRGNFEILTLAGSISPDGAHLHMSVADADGRVLGGHVGPGCIIRTTAELLIALLPEQHFARRFDPQTGYLELMFGAQSPA
jgi:hypothetical protein